MYSVIVGWSPQTGQSSRRSILTSLNSVASASSRSRRPTSGSPMSAASLIASFVCSVPTMPGRTPSTPPSEHDGAPAPDRRVVDEIPGGEVVCAVDDDVPAVVEDAVDVLGGEALAVGDDVDVRVERLDRTLRGVDLRRAEGFE